MVGERSGGINSHFNGELRPAFQMAMLNHIIIDLGPAFVVCTLFVLLLLAICLWVAARRGRVKSSTALTSLQNEIAHGREESAALKKQIQRLTSQTYIPDFRDENIYHIIAKHDIKLAGESATYGLVRGEDDAVKPFFTHQDMRILKVDDYFTHMRGELIKVGKKSSDDVSARPDETVSRPASSQPFELEVEKGRGEKDPSINLAGSIDQTVLFQRAPGGHKEYDEVYAGFPYLKVLSGNDQGTLFYLMFDRSSIGRGESCNLTLKDDNSSRVHCEIVFQNHCFVLKDNRSTNGTFCNGEQIQETVLDFGDTIQVGNTEMVFSFEGFELKETNPEKAILLFENCLRKESNFLIALKHLAFLMERDVARQKDAKPIWERIKMLERRKPS